MHGYWGRLLRVNLTTGEITKENMDEDIFSSYLGAKGVGAYYFCKEIKKGVEPLSPENPLILSTGPYQGTDIPATGRFAVITKSPLTGIFLDTYCGGWLGHSLKKCGYDIIIIEGAAERPSYISIKDDEVQINDASELWGTTTNETEDKLRELEGEKVRVISTGPAGENLVRIACLISDYRRSAGRGGSGAVFGSKNLKAVCVEGTKTVPIADGKKLKEVIRQIADNVKEERDEGAAFYKYGTSNAVDYASEKDRIPTRNYQQGEFEGTEEITGETLYQKYDVDMVGCCPCLIKCQGDIAGGRERPEYETLAMLGSNCGIDDLEFIIEGNTLCNQLGLDTISTGGVIGFAMECSMLGLIDEKFDFGDGELLVELIRKIAYREGVGDILADGVRKAAERIGNNADKLAVHVKGLEIPAWDPRGKLGHGLAYMTADIGGSHLRDFYSSKKIPDTSALEVMDKIISGQDRCIMRDNFIYCTFASDTFDKQMRRDAYEAITGFGLSTEKETEVSNRIWTLIRVYNIREGISGKDDNLPHRFRSEPLPSGVAEGCTAFVSEDDMELSLRTYYERRGWDAKGIPTEKTVSDLGLSWF
ncbi:MAG: aldehyde ferredoxin oxidoreductase family protein [Methanobacteriota archaeon]|nr:MAG: aldehyde ferredoxin oxidoreductase family protein [Euryarchaeota archaeon]